MNLEFKEEQNFRKWWHYAVAGFPVIIISTMFFLVQFDIYAINIHLVLISKTRDDNK
jgi:hypothetical protein